MKLIDLLVQELPKRGGWPDGADCSTVIEYRMRGDLLMEFIFPLMGDHNLQVKPYHIIINDVGYIERISSSHTITKEQYESALAASQKSAWNGEGLPPVGCECECQFLDAWHVCKVLFVGAEVTVGVIDGSERAFSVNRTKFRPLQSEAERKRDAAVEAIDYWLPEYIPNTPNEFYHAKKIYDAIAAGKIPGVKLDD